MQSPKHTTSDGTGGMGVGWLIKRGSDGGHFSFTFSWSRLDTYHHVREGRAQRSQPTRTSDCYWFSWKDRRHGWRTTWFQALTSLKEAMTETVREGIDKKMLTRWSVV